MKLSSIFLAFSSSVVAADEEASCLPSSSSFEIMVSGCSYSKLIKSIEHTLHHPDPQTHSIVPCQHSATKELLLQLSVDSVTTAESIVSDLCTNATNEYIENYKIDWSEITLKGDKFDKEYYDGNSDWNEEHQSNYPHVPYVPGEPSNVLSQDAERVDDLYETHIQRYPLQWPGDASTISNFAECKYQSAMCCWVSDRQANDNNGNCATPYDERCLDADPGDNTDLCGVDMSRSPHDSSHVKDGFGIFHANEEGPVHCHGLAWGEDESEADFRYRANNLFYVSMSDHMHDRGYVRNVQGAPMCGCIEHMPIVSRSDCTEIDAHEFYKFTFASDKVSTSLDYVDIDFNACNARRNNNLQSFVERLKDEGRLSADKYHHFRQTVVGDNQCTNAIRDLYFEKGYKYVKKTSADFNGWEKGRCYNADNRDQNTNVLKLGNTDYGKTPESLQECLDLCSSYSSEHRVTACEAVHSRGDRGCYLHTREVFRGSGENNYNCNVMNQYEVPAIDDYTKTNGFCIGYGNHDQNTGVVKLWGGNSFGPEEAKQAECLELCRKASGIRHATGCEAIWNQGNSGCYLHTKEVAKGNGADRHVCWVL